jgi:ABC-type transport system involved in cytochrome bd biosynthesis fused ATPase/permease subunit
MTARTVLIFLAFFLLVIAGISTIRNWQTDQEIASLNKAYNVAVGTAIQRNADLVQNMCERDRTQSSSIEKWVRENEQENAEYSAHLDGAANVLSLLKKHLDRQHKIDARFINTFPVLLAECAKQPAVVTPK